MNPYVIPELLGPRPPAEPPSLTDRVAQLQSQNVEFKVEIADAMKVVSELLSEVETLSAKQKRLEKKIESLEVRLQDAELRVKEKEPA